jgi:undecaprenyl-diphosphatase
MRLSASRHRWLLTWLRLWLATLALAVALTALVEFDAVPDEAGLMREVQASGFPGQTLSDAVRAITTTQFVVMAGVVMAGLRWPARGWRSAAILLVLVILLPVTQAGIKELVDRPRPSETTPGIEVRASQTSPSFPAGHVMGPTVVYGWALVVLLRSHRIEVVRSPGVHPGEARQHPGLNPAATRGLVRSVRWLLIACLAGVLLSTGIVNVYLGVHWPSDVLGGYLWGLVLLLPALGALAVPAANLPSPRRERGRG